jgi:hypothetical protein
MVQGKRGFVGLSGLSGTNDLCIFRDSRKRRSVRRGGNYLTQKDVFSVVEMVYKRRCQQTFFGNLQSPYVLSSVSLVDKFRRKLILVSKGGSLLVNPNARLRLGSKMVGQDFSHFWNINWNWKF